MNYAVILDGCRDEQNPWFYATTDYYNEETYETDYSKLAHITEVQAEELLAGMPDAADYALTSFEVYVQRSGAVSGDPPAGQSLVLDAYFDYFMDEKHHQQHCYHIPKWTLSGAWVEQLNEKIYNALYSRIQSEVNGSKEPFITGMSYAVGEKGELASLVVAAPVPRTIGTMFRMKTRHRKIDNALFRDFIQQPSNYSLIVFQIQLLHRTEYDLIPLLVVDEYVFTVDLFNRQGNGGGSASDILAAQCIFGFSLNHA